MPATYIQWHSHDLFEKAIACNRVIAPPAKVTFSQIGNALSPKIFNPLPSPQTFTPPPTGNGCFCIFHTWLLLTSTCSYFWSYYNWLNAVIIDFWRSWNNILKKLVLTIMLFYFLCVMTCLSLTLLKKLLNHPKKMFQSLGWMRKT